MKISPQQAQFLVGIKFLHTKFVWKPNADQLIPRWDYVRMMKSEKPARGGPEMRDGVAEELYLPFSLLALKAGAGRGRQDVVGDSFTFPLV